MNGDAFVVITNQHIYDELQVIKGDVVDIKTVAFQAAAGFADHETRIRVGESFQQSVKGGLKWSAAVAPLLIGAVALVLR